MDSFTQLIDIHRPVTVCKASAGTGKTYTLAAYYIGLLLSGEDYRSILAITFTNKATAEMSERILTYLYALSLGYERDFLRRARLFMIRDRHLSDEQLDERAGKCFRAMLADYDSVHVQTIDAFLQTLLNGLASVLHRSAGMSTELDIKHVIRQAVDQLLTTDLTPERQRIIERYTCFKLSQESSWDIRGSLRQLALELYNETAQVLDGNKQILFDAERIAERRDVLEQRWRENPERMQVEKILDELEATGLDFTHGKDIKSAIKNIRTSMDNPKEIKKFEDRFRGLTDTQIRDIEGEKWGKVPQAVQDKIMNATQRIRALKSYYYTFQLSIDLSRDMELMASLRQIIQRNLTEANCALLSRTASILSEALREGDADFILEKAGIRYRHVLIDEFQDTSRLQWNVIHHLLLDVLASEGNTLLIVGDIKQSIYRWRNGDWRIMEELTSDETNDLSAGRLNGRFTSLTRNFRSSEQVVRFNLELFNYLIDNYSKELPEADSEEAALARRIYSEQYRPELLSQFYQADRKQGGYVRFRTFSGEKKDEVKDAIAMDMFRTIEDLLSRGMKPSDMMVLVRVGSDASFLTEVHHRLNKELFPCLTNTSVVSETSFLLEASPAVCAIVAALKLSRNDKNEIARMEIEKFAGSADVIGQICTCITPDIPLYEAVSEIVRILLTDSNGQYTGSETAYINCFLDRTREYVKAYGSHTEDFLEYWDDTLKGESIPASSSGAIRIMTIHKSKGLQAQTLFIPFCHWKKDEGKPDQKIWCKMAPELEAGADFIPVLNKNEMDLSAYHNEYAEEHRNARIDTLNMLYVAVTRAEDNLYLYTHYLVNSAGEAKPIDHVGQYLIDYLKGEEYEAGEVKIKSENQLPSKTKEENGKPFSFEDAPKERAELWADSNQVRFVQSQEGAMYTAYGDESYRRIARMDEGTICHEIFSRIRKADELDYVLDEFMSSGKIKDQQQRETLKSLISSAWEGSPEMRDWFTSPWELELEHDVLIDHRKIRPDRVMINSRTNDAIVLDYKFGAWHGKPDMQYEEQVRNYMAALKELGHPSVRGYLWYARKKDHKLVEVDEK